MTSQSPDDTSTALLICLVGGPLIVAAVCAVGCLYSKIYNRMRRKNV